MIFDFHNDAATVNRTDIPKISALATVIFPVWTTRLSNPAKFLQANRLDDGLNAIEDLHFIDLKTAAGQKSSISLLKFFRPVYASLTWNHQNSFACGAFSDGGLTERGGELIGILNDLSITVDVAHLNKKSFWDVLDKANCLIDSHTCFDGVYKHPRNLDDDQIRAVIERGGIIALTAVSEFMGKEQAGIDDFMAQIDYFCDKFGADNLAIGTDFYGSDNTAIKNYDDFALIKKIMDKKGYKENSRKILYKNAINFLKRHKNSI